MIIKFSLDITYVPCAAVSNSTHDANRRTERWFYRRWCRLLVENYKDQVRIDHPYNRASQLKETV